MLTKKQLLLLQVIEKKIQVDGISPSFDEMREALNLKSKSGIHRLIVALEERGYLQRLPHRARALEVVKIVPSGNINNSSTEGKITDLSKNFRMANSSESIKVPLVGSIAAGSPIEAIQDNSQEVNIPKSMIGKGNHFALQVKGESMIEAGINDSDIVIIKQQSKAESGDIVVALIDEQEATLKKLKINGSIVELEPANQSFKTQKFHSSQVKIQGRLVGLLRTY